MRIWITMPSSKLLVTIFEKFVPLDMVVMVKRINQDISLVCSVSCVCAVVM